MSTMNDALVITGLTKRFTPEHGIFDINLRVGRGEVFGFLGPNGAGKSTTINTILDILRPDAGTVHILGLDHHAQAKAAHQHIGYLSGDMETDPSLTGRQYLTYVANLRQGKGAEKVPALAERLKADLTIKIKHLSRGNKQKISLIAALMHDPEILILDEPTSGLDPLIQAEFADIISEHTARGKSAFISSHVLSEVQSMCDRVGFIRSGTLLHVDSLEALLQKAPNQITIQCDSPNLEKELLSFEHATNITRHDNVITFFFNGDINQLLSMLSKYQLKRFTISEADLEALFMSYYQKGEEA